MPSERLVPHSKPRHISVYSREPLESHRRPSEPSRGHPRSVSAMVSSPGTGMMQTRDSTHSWAARNTDNAVVINGGRTWSVTSYLSACGRIQATLLGVLQFVNLFDEFRRFRGALLIGCSLAPFARRFPDARKTVAIKQSQKAIDDPDPCGLNG
jgi:hypothetical protein